MLLLTRPLPKLEASVAAFTQAGVPVTGVATSDIEYIDSAIIKLHQYFLQHSHATIIVTSVFAVSALEKAWTDAQSDWPILAVGDATAAKIKSHLPQARVFTPAQHTSEGILAMHQLNEANCEDIVIIKGEGGRDTLQNTLRLQGKQVSPFCVYKRVALAQPFYTNNWQIDDVSGIIATSENMAMQLIACHSEQILTLPWVTVSERIANALRKRGIDNVAVCKQATDQVLIAWIKDNWEY